MVGCSDVGMKDLVILTLVGYWYTVGEIEIFPFLGCKDMGVTTLPGVFSGHLESIGGSWDAPGRNQ